MELPIWLVADSERLIASIEGDQLPHALLVHGPVGTGRRALVFWLVERLLGPNAGVADANPLGSGRIDAEFVPSHPDFRFLQPVEDKQTISIDQVRELIAFLTLTSHQHGAKVAVITPAQAMTAPAADCLLKTLEEPTAGSYLVLVAESLSRLPATIVSRCHRIRVPLPPRADAARWLQGLDKTVDWHRALELSGGAPLTAVELQRAKFPQLANELERDVLALRQCEDTPASVAKRWMKTELEPCLRWLSNRLSMEIRAKLSQRAPVALKPGNRRLQKCRETLNMEPSFAVLRQIGELRRMHGTGLNAELHLTDVLARLYGVV